GVRPRASRDRIARYGEQFCRESRIGRSHARMSLQMGRRYPVVGMYRILLFVGVPLVEMALLIWAGDAIGIPLTLGIVFLTGVVGAALVKRQVVAVWQDARRRLAEGGMPTRELAHGA